MSTARRSIASLLLGLALVGIFAPTANAQQSPPSAAGNGMSATRCEDAISGGSGLGGGGASGGGAGGGGGGSWGGAPPSSNPSTRLEQNAADDEEHGLCATLLEEFAPGEDPGPYPSSHYDLGYDAGGSLSWWRKFSGWATDFVFGTDVWFVRAGLGIVNWVMGFELADALRSQAETISGAYQSQIIGPVNLGHACLTVCVLWSMFLALTGRVLRGAAETGVSLLIGSVAVVMWSNPAASLMGGLHFVQDVGNQVAAASMGTTPTPGDSVSAPMASAVHQAMVEKPHEWLNWGRAIPAGDPCRAVYDSAVASGPWGAADEPRDAMKAAGCNAEANFNHDPTRDRLVGAVIVSVGGAILMVLLVLMALTLLAGQLGILVAIVTAQFAFAFGSLPGRGRSLFWRWLASVAVIEAGILILYGIMALTLAGISAVLSATGDLGLLRQMVVVDLIAGYALVKRRSILNGGRSAVRNFAQRMASVQVGGQALRRQQVSWGQASAGAAVGGAVAAGWSLGKSAHRTYDGHQRRRYQSETRGYQREMRDAQRANGSTNTNGRAGPANPGSRVDAALDNDQATSAHAGAETTARARDAEATTRSHADARQQVALAP